MTENEAIKDIKRQLLEIDSEDADITLSTESLKMAIQALEKQSMVNELLHECKEMGLELEQYRAIGTVEEFKALKEGGRFLEFLYNHIPPNEMEQYLSMYQAKDKVAVNGYADQCGLMPAT